LPLETRASQFETGSLLQASTQIIKPLGVNASLNAPKERQRARLQ
jgi:hypothetical protein